MFSNSTQLKFWTFSGTTELNHLRSEVNSKYVKTHLSSEDNPEGDRFLSYDEESKIRRHYEYVLKEFCQKFQPPMPKYVLGTSMAYFKRFYLHHSVMDHHPRHLVYTSIYLACKVEEFNVSILQFVGNLPGDQDKAADLILAQELLLMHHLRYHLTVHNPFRPLEGLLIDIKTRCPEVDNPEKLRQTAEDFIDKALHTDVVLIFAPSQLALASLLHSATRHGYSLDSYVANKLLASGGKDNLLKAVEHIKRIKYMVKNLESLDREEVRRLETKLRDCLNPDNDPNTAQYHDRLQERHHDNDQRRAEKHLKVLERELQEERELIGV